MQYNVITQFMKDIQMALNETISECRVEGITKESIVILPSGDGAAIVFPSQQQHREEYPPFFLVFIKKLFFTIYKNNIDTGAINCDDFQENKYCDCHKSSYFLRYGVSIGELVVYNDLNNHENYAGTPINMASRVMGLAKKANQVALTEEAYQYLNEFYPNISRPELFRGYKNVEIKHNIFINVYQYIAQNIVKIGLDATQLDIDTNESSRLPELT